MHSSESNRRFSKQRACILIMLAATGPLAGGCVVPPADPAHLRRQFASLESRMEDAAQAHFESVHGVLAEDGSVEHPRAVVDGAESRQVILKKMDKLVRSASSEGGSMAVQTFRWATEIDPDAGLGRFQRLIRRHPDEPTLTEAIEYAMYAGVGSDLSGRWIRALRRLAGRTKRVENKVAALFSIGTILVETASAVEGRAAFEQVLKLAPESEYVQAAKAYLYQIDHLQIGMPAPDFSAKTLDGKDVSLSSLRGKVVLIDFWATWCPPCVAEIPHLKEAARKLKNRPFEILAISVDDARQDVANVVRSLGAPGIHTWDAKGIDNPVAELYAVQRFPTWYLIDAQGVIRARDPFGDHLVPAIEALLADTPSG